LLPYQHIGQIHLFRLVMASSTTVRRPTHVKGTELRRFVFCSTILCKIDPARGAPTKTSFDDGPNGDGLSTQQLKRKFLDSFALICSTSEFGAETASAACLEEHDPAGVVLRVARNQGLTPDVLAGLQGILQILRAVSRREKPSARAEAEIVTLVARLDRARILSIANKVMKHGNGICELVLQANDRLSSSQGAGKTGLKLWLQNCPFTGASPQSWDLATVERLVDWAAKARWEYSEQLPGLLQFDRAQKHFWLECLFKIARYQASIKSMVKLATKEPAMFQGIRILHVEAPMSCQFSIDVDATPGRTVVNYLFNKDAEDIMTKLKSHLGQNVEWRLRKACPKKLTLHAEMQLAVFYEGNPDLLPQMAYVGTSKKACFLCNEYLRHHTSRLQAGACHQKVYSTWMPPPCYQDSGRSGSTPFQKLSRSIENLTRRELKTSLAVPRRPINQDSTAGPDLTLTATVPTDWGLS
jgi:hypothetical protein